MGIFLATRTWLEPVTLALSMIAHPLLAFAGVLSKKPDAIARIAAVPDHLVRATCLLRRKPETFVAFWQACNRLHATIGRKFYDATTVSPAMHAPPPRSSSLVENLNSRIRTCLMLWRHLDGSRAWLGLLQFFFNHRRFMPSPCSDQVGKSPREVMTGEEHPHWLTLLGLGPIRPQRT